MIDIRTGDRRAAFEVPFLAYGESSPYVSPMWSDFDRMLDPRRNPLVTEGHGSFETFTAHCDGKPVGRIVASIHQASNRLHGISRGAFGFFDCVDDTETADALLDACRQWLSARGCTEMAGNFNLTAMQQIGIVTGGFENAPYTDMVWSPPHIAQHLERAGFVPFFPMRTAEIDLKSLNTDLLLGEAQARSLADNTLEWAPIRKRLFKECLQEARLVLNDGFARNPMFVATSQAEYFFQAGDMTWIVDTRLPVLVRRKGRPIGVIVCIPDLNPFVKATRARLSLATPWHFLKSRITRERAVIIYYSVVADEQGQGLNGAMLHRLVGALKRAGYKKLGVTWVADENAPSLRQLEKLGAKVHNRLHLFRKPIASNA